MTAVILTCCCDEILLSKRTTDYIVWLLWEWVLVSAAGFLRQPWIWSERWKVLEFQKTEKLLELFWKQWKTFKSLEFVFRKKNTSDNAYKKVDVRACGFIYFIPVASDGQLWYLRFIHVLGEFWTIYDYSWHVCTTTKMVIDTRCACLSRANPNYKLRSCTIQLVSRTRETVQSPLWSFRQLCWDRRYLKPMV